MKPVTDTASTAPLPLTRKQAMQRAYELRAAHHLSYPAISRVIGEYHGVWLSESVWRAGCRRRGAMVDIVKQHRKRQELAA